MCLESLVAIMAMIAACTLEPGVYLSMNVKGDPASTVATINALNFPVTLDQMNQMADQLGEKNLFGRTGGAATLAVGMAQIFSKAVNGRGLDLWYHFAIMFEALFILTTLDAGTRVGRYLLQDALGNLWKPLGDTRSIGANALASLLVVGGWGYFLIQGVRDPLGGINSLWPLFGIANQLLAAIALCLGTTIILKMSLQTEESKVQSSKSKVQSSKSSVGRPVVALITFTPLVWLLAVTMTAGVQKIFHSDTRIGFLAQARALRAHEPSLEQALTAAKATRNAGSIEAALKALRDNRVQQFNNNLDAFVAAGFLALVAAIFLLSAREWLLLLARRKLAELRESDSVWLPDRALAKNQPLHMAGLLALTFALAKELSGEAQMERLQSQACARAAPVGEPSGLKPADQTRIGKQTYLAVTRERFHGIRRCC
jgi:carbon starvation protein